MRYDKGILSNQINTMERLQLNVRMDGKQQLLADIKAAAAKNDESLNVFCVRILSEAVYGASKSASTITNDELDKILDTKLADILARIDSLEGAIAKTPQQENNQPGKYRVKAA